MTWTIDELGEACAKVLADEPQPSGRVNDAPDVRTIRYYTALGLLDPPQAFVKKKAMYGARHLMQLVAIKRLQRTGLALADVQRQLAGIGDARLRSIARLDDPPARLDDPPARGRFWTREPAAIQASRIAPGVTLVIERAARPFGRDDEAALRVWLAGRGLISPEEDER